MMMVYKSRYKYKLFSSLVMGKYRIRLELEGVREYIKVRVRIRTKGIGQKG